MKKLTATQMKVYQSITAKCDKARAAGSAREWFNAEYSNSRNADPYSGHDEYVRSVIDYNWNETRNGRGIKTFQVNTRTLQALEAAGLIVVNICGGYADSVNLLNY